MEHTEITEQTSSFFCSVISICCCFSLSYKTYKSYKSYKTYKTYKTYDPNNVYNATVQL